MMRSRGDRGERSDRDQAQMRLRSGSVTRPQVRHSIEAKHR